MNGLLFVVVVFFLKILKKIFFSEIIKGMKLKLGIHPRTLAST